MKMKLVSFLMLASILTSMLGTAFLVKLSSAVGAEGNLVNGDIAEKVGKANSSHEPAPASLEQTRNQTSSHEGETARRNEDRWNFSDASVWDNSTYANGGKVRLVIGVDSTSPSSLVTFERITAEHYGKIVNEVSIGNEMRALVVELPLSYVTSFVADAKVVSSASYVEPVMKVQALFVPNDPLWGSQWGPQKIGAEWAWNVTMGNQTVLVAVIDTGIDYTHPDLAANYVPLGYDWVNMDSDPKDDFGHGTHCAGIIAAVSNNSEGIAGLAQVRIMSEKVLDSQGYGYSDWLANGIAHAVDQGANVLSISLGGYGDSEIVHEAIKYAYGKGVLVVASAGNSNSDVKPYPAGYDEVVAVAATDQNDNKASFSNWGDWIELAAPGVDVVSTMPTYHVTLNDYGYPLNYAYLSGTSMACPHFSGIAALTWSQYTNRTRDWLRLWMRYTADDLGDPGFDFQYGYGRLNARKAVEQAPPTHELMIYGLQTPPYVKPETTSTITATVLNFGENDENNVEVQLLANDSMVDSASIGLLAGLNSSTADLTWAPTIEGLYNLTVYVKPAPGETNLENNVVSKFIYVGTPVKAVVLHSAGNITPEIITNWQVLNTEWQRFGDKMIYLDYTTLSKDNITYEDLVTAEADVLIISCAYDSYAGWEFTDSEIEAITRYVHEGHGLIATAGTFYNSVQNNNKLAPLFGIKDTITWTATETDLLELVNATHPIFNQVPNPLVIPLVGTAIPSGGQWDSNALTGGTYLATGHFKESAIVTYRGLVYISAWLEVIPPYYHHHLQLLYNAIAWSQYQKPQHELIVSLKSPQHLNPGEPTLLNATVENRGRNNETNVNLQLLIDGVITDAVTMLEFSADSSCTLTYLWTPTAQGRYNVTAYAPPVPGEEIIQNNIAEKTVLVLSIAVRSVLVYSDDYVVEPTSRYVILALDELGINYTYYADDPWGFGSALANQPWDLVIVDHCSWYALGNYFNEIDDYVRNGGSLVLSTFAIDGYNSGSTTLWDTLRVQWVSEMPNAEPVHRWIPSHPLFTFSNTLGDLTSYVEGYSDHGDHVANTTSTAVGGFTNTYTDGYAGIVVGNTYPTVLFSFILDEFRYDQNGDGRPDALDLWENAIVYLAKGQEHDLAVTLNAPSFPRPNDSTLLNATIRNRGTSDETSAELQLFIDGTIIDFATIPLQHGSSYTLSYLWTPAAEATYNITAYAPPVRGEDVTANNIATNIVVVSTTIRVAVLGDYNSQLTSLLVNNSILATERDWSVIENIYEYDVVVINRPDDPGQSTFLSLINASDKYRVGLVFTSSWPGSSAPYGITLLEEYLYDPGGQDCIWGAGSVYYQVAKDHPIFEGWNVGDKIYVITTGDRDHAWFGNYSGETVANIGDDTFGIRGGGIAYKIRENGNKHLLLAGLAPQYYANIVHWTEDAKLLFVRGVWWASKPVVYEHDLGVTLDAPAYLKRGDSALLNYTVRNAGLNNETGVTLSLLINESVVDSATIPLLLAGQSYTIDYYWTPARPENYNVTAFALPVPGEEIITNNVMTIWSYVQGIHDVAITNVEPSSHQVLAGNPIDIGVSVENHGDYYEDFTVTAYASPQTLSTTSSPPISNATRVYLDPSKYIFNVSSAPTGYRFNVTLRVADVEDLLGWQVKLSYNSSLINASRWFEPTQDPEYVFYGEPTTQADFFGTDDIMMFAGLRGVLTTFNGNGKLCIVEFEIMSVPSTGKCHCNLGINNEKTQLYDSATDQIPAVEEDGYYELGPEEYVIGTTTAMNLGPGERLNVNITWSTSDTLPGEYEISATASIVPGETRTEDNTFTDGTVVIQAHDVGISEITPAVQWVYQGFSANISVTIRNKVNSAENVTVTLYYDNAANKTIGAQVINLPASENKTIVFTWRTATVEYGRNYTITAVASIPIDNNPADNILSEGSIQVRILGDVNADGAVDGSDLIIVARAFGSYPNHPRWNPIVDVSGDGMIDGLDLIAVARNFGKFVPP